MNYAEAKELAESWTKDHDVDLDGWRSVIAILMQRIKTIEAANKELCVALAKMQMENEALSLDLGLKEMSYILPPQPQLKDLAETINELQKREDK